MKQPQPNTRFTRIQTTVLADLRRHCKRTKEVQADLVSKAVTAYLRRAALVSKGVPKTSTLKPGPRRTRKK